MIDALDVPHTEQLKAGRQKKLARLGAANTNVSVSRSA